MSYFKKSKTPYEVKNAWELNPNNDSQDLSSPEGDENDSDSKTNQSFGPNLSSRSQQVEASPAQGSLNNDDEGFQPVIHRFTKQKMKAEGTRKPQGNENRSNNNSHNELSSASKSKRSQSNNDKAAIRSPQTASTLPAARRAPQIVHDDSHKPHDPVLPLNPSQVKRIQSLKLCHGFYLHNDCPNDPCPFNHRYRPNEFELRTLRSLNKATVCKYGRNCHNKNCTYGHPSAEPQKTGSSKPAQKEKVQPSQQLEDVPFPLPRQMFIFETDNAARAAFRQRQDPSGSFELHKDIIEIEPDLTRLEMFLEELGHRLGAFIRPPQTANDRKLLIWANQNQLTKTYEELKSWIRQSEEPSGRKALGKKNFGHEYSTIGDRYKTIQKETLKRAEILRFQQIPDPDQHFEHKGAYLWPIEDVKPQDIFGLNLEAFDEIRFSLKCHIVFDDRLQVFRIYTEKESAVAKALKLIEGTLREFHARNVLNFQLKPVHLVDPTQHKTAGEVSLRIRSPSAGHQIPVFTNCMLVQEAKSEWEVQSREMTTSNAIRMQNAIQFALSNLKHFRGHIRIKILLGTFAMTRFRWPREMTSSIPFEDFIRSLAQPGTKGILIRDLCLHTKESELLYQIYSLKDIFEPLDGMIESLREVAPMYGARFEINRFEKSSVQLEVDITSNAYERDLYEKTHVLWTNLDRKDHTVPLDIFMIRLGGGPSWKLQIAADNQLDRSRIDQKMVHFAESVKLKRGSKVGAELDGRRLFEWETALPGCLKPSVFEQKIALRYRLKSMPEFVFEIARYDSYDLLTNSQTPSTTHWGASMWNTEWDIKLSKNANLGLGESAGWDPRIEMFFPTPEPEPSNKRNQGQEEVDPGLRLFLQNVQSIVESLNAFTKTPSDV